jgi:hypothetical protein
MNFNLSDVSEGGRMFLRNVVKKKNISARGKSQNTVLSKSGKLYNLRGISFRAQ